MKNAVALMALILSVTSVVHAKPVSAMIACGPNKIENLIADPSVQLAVPENHVGEISLASLKQFKVLKTVIGDVRLSISDSENAGSDLTLSLPALSDGEGSAVCSILYYKGLSLNIKGLSSGGEPEEFLISSASVKTLSPDKIQLSVSVTTASKKSGVKSVVIERSSTSGSLSYSIN